MLQKDRIPFLSASDDSCGTILNKRGMVNTCNKRPYIKRYPEIWFDKTLRPRKKVTVPNANCNKKND